MALPESCGASALGPAPWPPRHRPDHSARFTWRGGVAPGRGRETTKLLGAPRASPERGGGALGCDLPVVCFLGVNVLDYGCNIGGTHAKGPVPFLPCKALSLFLDPL